MEKARWVGVHSPPESEAVCSFEFRSVYVGSRRTCAKQNITVKYTVVSLPF